MSRIRLTNFGVAIIDGDTHLSKWVEERGRLDCEDLCNQLCSKYIKPGDVIVDAGACIGDHTLAYLKASGVAGRVIAFEPNPEAFECLRYNCPEANCFKSGLGNGYSKMGVYPSDNVGASQLRELSPNVQEANIIPLDSMKLCRLDFLKIDVEGMELDVMRGASETIKKCRPVMLVELNDTTLARFGETKKTIIDYMASVGYHLEDADPGRPLTLEQIDVLFVPNETLPKTP